MSTIHETIYTLEKFNEWRHGNKTTTAPEPFEVGVAIGDAVRLLRELFVMTARAEKAEADTARLDWLDENMGYSGGGSGGTYTFFTPADVECGMLRDAIDAAMKEGSK